LATVFSWTNESCYTFSALVMSGALAWSLVWLFGQWMAVSSRLIRLVLIFCVLFALGLLADFCQFEAAYRTAALIYFSASAAILLLSMLLTGFFCRRRFSPQRYLGGLLLWTVIVTFGLFMAIFILGMILNPNPREMGVALVIIIPATVLIAGLIYLFNLPFLLLAFNTSFYRRRFKDIFLRPQDDRLEEEEVFYRPPLIIDPARGPVAAEDLAGPWEFYLDRATRTVTLDFHLDGTFAQTIVSNQGEIVQCPGGTWRLAGSLVHLEGYLTAAEGVRQSRTWWMIDTPSGLALFGGDGPDAASFFVLQRPMIPLRM
jgi:hypothetical protein